MLTPIITTILNPALMLERAVDGLFPLPPATPQQPWPTLSAWIVLRQGGLRDDLHRLSAAKGVAGWFDPPICLFNEVSSRWASESASTPLTEPERQAILSELVPRVGGTFFSRGAGTTAADAWVPGLDHLIGELVSEGIAPGAWQQALLQTATDTFARGRAEALGHIYTEWLATVARVGRPDGRDAKVRLAAEITADPAGFSERLGGRRDVRIVGLADLRGGWRPLLAALAASPALDRLELITSAPLQLPAALVSSAYSPSAPETFASALFGDAKPVATSVRLIEAPDAAREVELIAVRVRALLDSDVAPTRIAVVARQARPLVNDLTVALGKLGVPVTARQRTTLSHTAPARALRCILAAHRDEWSRHSVAELAENPLLATGLDAGVVNFVGYSGQMTSRAAWREGFAELLARCEGRDRGEDDEDEHRQPLPETVRVQATLDAWVALDARLAQVEAGRSAAEWSRWVADTLREDGWGLAAALARPIADADAWRADVRAADQIAESALAWAQALTDFGGAAPAIGGGEFAERLRLLLEQDLITPPATDFGVVVGEALATGWRAFDHVFVVGLSAGAFPQRPAPGGLLDRDDRLALIAAGVTLDDPDAWRLREQELFRVICAAPRQALTLSWPVMDASGRDVARSAFVDEAAVTLARALGVPDNDASTDDALAAAGVLERVPTNEALVAGFPVASDTAAIAHARAGASRENARTREPSEWNGRIEDPTLQAWMGEKYGEQYTWSATQLEQVAKCRWHWMAQRLLHLDPRADADDLMEPTVRGSLVHDALNRFFVAARAIVGGPVYLLDDDGRWRALMAQSLSEAWAAAEARGEWLGPVALRAVAKAEIEAELLGYLAFEIAWNVKSSNNRTNAAKQVRTGFDAGEFAFNHVKLSGGGTTFLLRGSIDRIDRGVDERINGSERYIAAIDYKSTKYSTPAAGDKKGWDDGVVLQVPLYAAALRQLNPDDLLARMEYRTVRKPEAVHTLSLAPVKAKAVQDAPDAESKLSGALDAAGRRVEQVRAGELPASPAASCGCSPYCPARDICRIPGGPVELGW